MKVAAYVRVSTDDQNEERQIRAIREKYDDPEQATEIEWYCDLGESGASISRAEYQRLREHVTDYDVVVVTNLIASGDRSLISQDSSRSYVSMASTSISPTSRSAQSVKTTGWPR